MSTVLTRLGLELHPEKTRTVDLSRGREGFDFLGCHLRKRMSGPLWERTRQRVYYLQRWPSQRAMARVRARVRELTPRARCHEDLRTRHRGRSIRCSAAGGSTFARAMRRRNFIDIDRYVEDRLRGLLRQARGRRVGRWSGGVVASSLLRSLGLIRLRGTIQYPGAAHATT